MTEDVRIETQGLGMSFSAPTSTSAVLRDLNIRVSRHEFVSVLGPSGCGKSTLFNIIAGLIEPSEGKVAVDGRSDSSRVGQCGYMMQRDLLMPWKTVAANVALGRIVKGAHRTEAFNAAREILNRYGLEEFADHYPNQLSGGMRQRAALARTFLAAEEILLLDEPFGALDSLTRLRMQSWLLNVWQESAASILFITHDVDEAIRLSDRVYVLTERPATVAVTLEVTLERPRPYEVVLTPEFASYKATALDHLHTGAGALFGSEQPDG